MAIALGYQIPNFTYPGGGPGELFPTVAAQAREAEAGGFDSIFVMDHFYQLPGIGKADEPMLEAYSTLSALAAHTSHVQLSTLVSGNTYRNPALLAKIVTTLDVISQGRAILGLGAGWFEHEHNDMGFEFGTFSDRFERLDEALQIIAPMLRDERPHLDGKWYQARGPMNVPRIRERIPILIGGSGEKKTFRLAARFADHINMICPEADLPRKLHVLRQRCEEIGRDPKTLETSFLLPVVPVENPREADPVLDRLTDYMRVTAKIGTPEEIAEHIAENVLAHGVDGILVSLPYNGCEPGRITQVAEHLRPMVAEVARS